MSDKHQDEFFQFYVPVDVAKAGKNGEMVLDGIASTSDTDQQNEDMIPEGFDYQYFLDHGYVNWHHQLKNNPDAVIGEPIAAEVSPKGFYVKARLYPSSDQAKKAYKLAKTLKKDSKTRRLGWSIEGKVLERDPANNNKVTKARITGVALTPMPINANTYVNVLKAMSEGEDMPKPQSSNGGGRMLLDATIEDGKITLSEDGILTVDLKKTMTTQSAGMLMPEHVEGTKPKNLANSDQGDDEEEEAEKSENEGFIAKSNEEVYEYLFEKYPNMTVKEAVGVMERIRNKR